MCPIFAGSARVHPPVEGHTQGEKIGGWLGRAVEPFGDNGGFSGSILLSSLLRSAAQTFAINVPLNSVFGVPPCTVNLSNDETRLDVWSEVHQSEDKKLLLLGSCRWVVGFPEDSIVYASM